MADRKTVEIIFSKHEKWHETYAEARRIASSNPHTWQGTNRLVLHHENNKKITICGAWEVEQSGYAGPEVLQMVTATDKRVSA